MTELLPEDFCTSRVDFFDTFRVMGRGTMGKPQTEKISMFMVDFLYSIVLKMLY